MTDEEIRTSYRDAANKKAQLTILSELTLRPIRELREVLGLDTPPAPKLDGEKLQADYDSGMLDSEIAKKHKVKTADVAEWRKGRGLVRNSRKKSEEVGRSRKKSEAEGVTIRDALVVTEPAEVVPTPRSIPASTQPTDPVTRPAHYTQGEIETIDYIRDTLTAEEFVGYCKGNVLKYISREQHKNGTEDLEEAQIYLNWAVERRETDEL